MKYGNITLDVAKYQTKVNSRIFYDNAKNDDDDSVNLLYYFDMLIRCKLQLYNICKILLDVSYGFSRS